MNLCFLQRVGGSSLFSPEVGGDFDEIHDKEREGADCHDQNKEIEISHHVLQIAGYHAGEHHAESHKSGAECVMADGRFAL